MSDRGTFSLRADGGMRDGPPGDGSTDGHGSLSTESDPPETGREEARDGGSRGTEDSLGALVRRLEDENDRLREQYARVRSSRYARTSLGLAAVGVVAGLAALVVTDAQEVLFTIAATGLFAAVLTRYLTPERFVPREIGEGMFATLSANEAGIAAQLGLSSTRIYLVTDSGPRLFVPEVDAFDRDLLDESAALTQPLVVGDTATRSGLALRPVADPLLRELESTQRSDLPSTPHDAATTLAEAVTDVFELATAVETNVIAAQRTAIFQVTEPLYGSTASFDHPVVSVFGVGLAEALETPVEVDVEPVDRRDRATALVTCRWRPDARGDGDRD
jgi:hypothetical protein